MRQNVFALGSNANVSVKTDINQLLAVFQSGDPSAFSKLYDLHVDMLYHYGSKLTPDRELLKDCIQDVFIKIYSKRTELGNINNFKSYLLISLKNKLCDEVRKRVNVSDVAVEELNPIPADCLDDCYINREKEYLKDSYVRELLNQLPPRQREALHLYYLEEKKYEDICEIMKMNYQSVRNLMHRALSKLRTITPAHACLY